MPSDTNVQTTTSPSAATVTLARNKYVRTLVLIASQLLLLWAGVVGASAASFSGIYVLSEQDAPIPFAVLGKPSIDGLALRYSWKQLEPRESVFNWSPIDVQLAAARMHGKKASLGVTAGVRTPAWVYAAGAKSFSFFWNKSWGPAICSRQRIPIPWDPVYLAKWDAFVRAFGARYGHNSTIVYVKITGINATTQEAILPHSRGAIISHLGVTCVSGDEVASWQEAGYSRGKIERAWKHIGNTFAESFPNVPLGLMIGPAGFPPIDDQGRIIPKSGADRKLPLNLIADGIQSYGARFVVQNNGLSAVKSWPELQDLSGRTNVGWQMAWSATADAGCKMNGGVVPCDPQDILQSAISRGIESGAVFLEIYAVDFLNPALRDILTRAHDCLSSHRCGKRTHVARHPSIYDIVAPPKEPAARLSSESSEAARPDRLLPTEHNASE